MLVDALVLNCSDVVVVRPQSRAQSVNNQIRVSSFWRLLHTASGILRDFFSLARQRGSLKGADCYYIPYPAYIDFLFLRFLTWGDTRRIVVVDAFLCLHDTLVLDRKMIAGKGIAARLVSWLERQTLAQADLVYIDTVQQQEILIKEYGLDEKRIAVIPVGIDEEVWSPAPRLTLNGQFTVLFWGTFIPLHGVDTIIKAAEIIQKSHAQISFTLIGDGQTAAHVSSEIDKLDITNINWNRRLLSASELRRHVDASHCVLGIFGDSEKAGNVIPYKAYQAMACNKILITRSGPAFSDLVNGKEPPGLYLVAAADPAALAASIIKIYDSYDEIQHSLNTKELYEQSLSNAVIQRRIASSLGVL